MAAAAYLALLDAIITASFVGWAYSAGFRHTSLFDLGVGCASTAALNVASNAVLPAVFKALALGDDGEEARKKRYSRFHEMINTLVQMAFFVYVEGGILGKETWFDDTKTIWDPNPNPAPADLRRFYSLNLGCWLTAAVTCRFFEERNKDWLLMYTHHATSIILVAGSACIGQERIGLMVLFLHHVSDIVLNICQSAHYLGWDGDHFPMGLPIAEVLFVCNMLCWVCTRLYLFPTKIIWTVVFEMHEDYICGGDGAVYCQSLSVLLFVLQAMHIYWFYEMVMVLVKVLTPGVK
eukprot:CAMPEP_0182471332 /NCGR_PEP_ID=MMETSP1319-20130603/20138_1 /TAXON_ID=172717 /ORGANISM="Bolidomonas pacifica, Strain RCC208" /LENGTH=292 /DNA_ID=CAMNT_0024671877 /DNA_START=252 /DNA_END=1127 /DNA_ORIENTATION=+